ncbi:MAG: GNAT family N-acetyltransferase [Streptomycetaceae bacterium]|nr:GNAT family N-acetyltransferase [Streptomycetaceae bacterium]
MPESALERLDADQAHTVKHHLRQIYADAYAKAAVTPFSNADEFHDLLPRHLAKPGYTLILARVDDVPAGFCYGYHADPEQWFGPDTLRRLPFHLAEPGRLLALCELVVAPEYQRQGLGTALHDALIEDVRPRYTSLHVLQDNIAAWSVYQRLGYEQVGVQAPEGVAAPLFDVLVLDNSHVV